MNNWDEQVRKLQNKLADFGEKEKSKRIKVIEAFAKTSSIDSLNQNITASKGTI
ncbi:18090_t:CDS:2 [Entrophospora sp. SA101]|nr:18090_t:CDS:2 [Entrophospora sp. SA101]